MEGRVDVDCAKVSVLYICTSDLGLLNAFFFFTFWAVVLKGFAPS